MLALPWRQNEALCVNGVAVAVREGSSACGDGRDTTGEVLWDASQALCDWLRVRWSAVDASHVVELGAGTGALAVALKWLGAQRVTATDGSAERCANVLETAALNGVAVETTTLVFGDVVQLPELRPTLVVAADCVYAPDMVAPLCATLGSVACARVLCMRHRSVLLAERLEAALPPGWRRELHGDFIFHVFGLD